MNRKDLVIDANFIIFSEKSSYTEQLHAALKEFDVYIPISVLKENNEGRSVSYVDRYTIARPSIDLTLPDFQGSEADKDIFALSKVNLENPIVVTNDDPLKQFLKKHDIETRGVLDVVGLAFQQEKIRREEVEELKELAKKDLWMEEKDINAKIKNILDQNWNW